MRRLIFFCLFAAACGDPLITRGYVGTPELSLRGVVQQANMRIPANHGPLAISVFWIGSSNSGSGPIEQDARLDSGVAEYSMTLFDPPPADASSFSELLFGNPLSIGVIALYADKNDSGALELDSDLLIGASAQHLLVYAGAEVSSDAPAAMLLGAIPAGYAVFRHEVDSTCRFVSATSCAPEGSLRRAEDLGAITLTLWDEAANVVVPAPALIRDGMPGSVWSVAQ